MYIRGVRWNIKLRIHYTEKMKEWLHLRYPEWLNQLLKVIRFARVVPRNNDCAHNASSCGVPVNVVTLGSEKKI